MASVFQRGGKWYVRIKHNGTWRNKVTSAATKAQAKGLAQEWAVGVEQRQRIGLDALPMDGGMTLGDLCEWWLAEWCPEPSLATERLRLGKHVAAQPLAKTPLRFLTPGLFDARLREMEKDGSSSATVNRLRTCLHSIFARAKKAGLWTRDNPLAEVEVRRVAKRAYSTITAEEAPRLLQFTPEEWRGVFATALYAGLRKGEILGLRKADVNLDARTLRVARSYDAQTTKGGHADEIPLPAPLAPYLEAAMASAVGELVFPWADGSMRGKGTDPQKVLRTALSRAGLVEGYLHTCRRCKANGRPCEVRSPAPTAGQCPTCSMRLWVKALPRPLRFHDLRHSTATILMRAKVDAHRVQRILRHRDVRTTTSIYAHLAVDDLREGMDQAFGAPEVAKPEPLAAQVLQAVGDRTNKNPGLPENIKETGALLQWAHQVSNLGPLPCEGSALPLSYAPEARP